jgi:hypothetical protein
MTQYAKVTALGTLSPAVSYQQAASPEELQDKINAVIALVDSALFAITAITLSGAGDGHTFVALIETAPVANVNGDYLFGIDAGLQVTKVRCYLAGSADELVPARLRAGAPDPVVVGNDTFTWSIVDEQLAGGAKGTRFMGMSVYSLVDFDVGGVGSPIVLVQSLGTPQVLSAGANVVLFTGLVGSAIQFSLPAAGAVQYDGSGSFIGKFFGTAAIEQTNANQDISLAIVRDPNGAAAVIGQMNSHISTATEYDSVAVYGFALIERKALSIPNAQFGLIVTAAGAGVMRSAQLMITQ